MTDELVLTDVRADGVATLRLNRPPMNALSQALLGEIAGVARDFADDDAVKAVVVLGGEKAFAAGADITEFGDQAAAKRVGRAFRTAFDGLAAIPRPVIAAINGFALGGGLELAMSCDLRIAGDKARRPAGDPARDHPRRRRHAATDPPRRTGEGQGAGVERAAGARRRSARDRSRRPRRAGRRARGAGARVGGRARVGRGRRDGPGEAGDRRGLDGSLARGLDVEADAFVEVFGTEDARAGVASFLEHGPGKATFQGR